MDGTLPHLLRVLSEGVGGIGVEAVPESQAPGAVHRHDGLFDGSRVLQIEHSEDPDEEGENTDEGDGRLQLEHPPEQHGALDLALDPLVRLEEHLLNSVRVELRAHDGRGEDDDDEPCHNHHVVEVLDRFLDKRPEGQEEAGEDERTDQVAGGADRPTRVVVQDARRGELLPVEPELVPDEVEDAPEGVLEALAEADDRPGIDEPSHEVGRHADGGEEQDEAEPEGGPLLGEDVGQEVDRNGGQSHLPGPPAVLERPLEDLLLLRPLAGQGDPLARERAQGLVVAVEGVQDVLDPLGEDLVGRRVVPGDEDPDPRLTGGGGSREGFDHRLVGAVGLDLLDLVLPDGIATLRLVLGEDLGDLLPGALAHVGGDLGPGTALGLATEGSALEPVDQVHEGERVEGDEGVLQGLVEVELEGADLALVELDLRDLDLPGSGLRGGDGDDLGPTLGVPGGDGHRVVLARVGHDGRGVEHEAVDLARGRAEVGLFFADDDPERCLEPIEVAQIGVLLELLVVAGEPALEDVHEEAPRGAGEGPEGPAVLLEDGEERLDATRHELGGLLDGLDELVEPASQRLVGPGQVGQGSHGEVGRSRTTGPGHGLGEEILKSLGRELLRGVKRQSGHSGPPVQLPRVSASAWMIREFHPKIISQD